MVELPQFTPVHLITGFLGSGKTTLLKRWLASPDLADTAVLINEFGEVGLDHELLERIDADAVLLSSGCLCCTVRGELAEAIKSLHSRRERGVIPPYRRLVIESSGLADPLPILTTIAAEPQLRHHYRVGRIVTTVDAVNGGGQLDRQPESRKQAAVADRLVVTKADIAEPERTRELVTRLLALNPAAPLRFSSDASLTPGELIGAEVARPLARGPTLVPRRGGRRSRPARAQSPRRRRHGRCADAGSAGQLDGVWPVAVDVAASTRRGRAAGQRDFGGRGRRGAGRRPSRAATRARARTSAPLALARPPLPACVHRQGDRRRDAATLVRRVRRLIGRGARPPRKGPGSTSRRTVFAQRDHKGAPCSNISHKFWS